MSDSFTSGSFPSSRVVAYNLTERFEKTDRKLVAVIYGMDALWYSEQAKEEEVRSIRFPVILGGISPIRFLVYGATSGKDMPEDTATKGYRLFVEFVSLNKEAVGFGGELQFNPRDVSSVRLPLALFLEAFVKGLRSAISAAGFSKGLIFRLETSPAIRAKVFSRNTSGTITEIRVPAWIFAKRIRATASCPMKSRSMPSPFKAAPPLCSKTFVRTWNLTVLRASDGD